MPSVSLSLPAALAGRARTWVCLSCMFWVSGGSVHFTGVGGIWGATVFPRTKTNNEISAVAVGLLFTCACGVLKRSAFMFMMSVRLVLHRCLHAICYLKGK